MKGDFSRIRFNRLKGYRWVLGLQGRVALEADANEQCFIEDYLGRTETVDVIGEFGGPRNDAGCQITVAGSDIMIGAGRYYADGLLCENPTDVSYDSQQYLLDATASGPDLLSELANSRGRAVVQVYLEAWERFVTALDDPCLREPALGQADTTGRLQTVWRVVATLTDAPAETPGDGAKGLAPCCQAMSGGRYRVSSGKMTAQTSGASADCGCEPVPAAGYQGVENQLYRVEIHNGGNENEATFKWSRENASVVSAVSAITGATVQVNSLGPDANLGYQVGQWVELSDDNDLFGQTPNQPGKLYQIQTIQPVDPSMTLTGGVTPVNPAQNARLRRWDQSGPTASADGIPLSAGTWVELENGIEICFQAGTYNAGDYWTIPARTATGTVDWPPCGGDDDLFQPPQTAQVYRAPLACIHWRPVRFHPRPRGGLALEGELLRRGRYVVDDCRLLFDPLTVLSKPKQADALHVESISWTNDDVISLDQLIANGLEVTLDQPPTGPINGANFVVSVEPIMLPFKGARLAGVAPMAVRAVQDPGKSLEVLPPGISAAGTFIASEATHRLLPSTFLREITIVDAQIAVNDRTISWTLGSGRATAFQQVTILFLNDLIRVGAAVGLYARVRVRLLGQTIFGDGPSGQMYLDGEAFGEPGMRADRVTPRIDLKLPSGDKRTASDLESWFYLAPILGVESLTIDYTPVTVVPDNVNNVTEVTADVDGNTETVTPTATVTLGYPPVNAGEVTLTIVQDSGPAVTLPEIPASESFGAGEQTVTFPVTVLANPGDKQKANYTITATLTGGQPASMTVEFEVIGAPVPVELR
jgi:hypothetical protein